MEYMEAIGIVKDFLSSSSATKRKD
jgi:hypothetical protein